MPDKLKRGIVCVVVTAVIWWLPVPAGLRPEALHMFALFFGTILGFILQPVANSTVVIVSTVFGVGAGLIKLSDALGTWSNSIIWLVFAAFLFARGFIKSGLGKRIAYWLTHAFGDSTLKLAYVLALNDLIISPATPSNIARAGGIMFPIVKSLIVALGSEPGPTARKAGSFLIMSSVSIVFVTSAMFVTSMVSNSLIVELARKTVNIDISWTTWFLAGIVPGLVSIIAIPLFLYLYYPPELKKIPQAKALAAAELEKMGPVTIREKGMAAIFFIVLGLWATSTFTKLDATFIGLVGVSLMLLSTVIEWQDVLEEKAAWDVFIWLGGTIGLAGFLANYGFITWFAQVVSAHLVGIPWVASWLLIVLIYFYAQYGFAGVTPHLVLMYSGFTAVAVAAGTPPFLAAFSLAAASSLCGSLTHFGTAPAAIYYGAGYVDQATWWKLGIWISIINLIIWLGVGSLWWKVLGLW